MVSSTPVVTSGTLEEGLANGQRLLVNHPNAALQQAETLLKLGPDARVLRLAAKAHRALGEVKKAEAAEIVAIEVSLKNPLLKEAARAEHEGRTEEASRMAAEFLRSQPDDLLALTISAETAISARRLTRAEEMLREILARAPQFIRATMLLIKCLMLQARLADGLALLEDLLEKKPNNEVALRLQARLLSDTRNYDRAAAVFERLFLVDDSEIDLWINYASALRFLGRRQDAELALRRALSTDQAHGGAWWALADLAPDSIRDAEIEKIRSAIADSKGNPTALVNLNFALGVILDRKGDHEAAFSHLSRGNETRLSLQPYDAKALAAEVDRSIEVFTPAFFARHKSAAVRDTAPIFIVGMPRSGSTMIERVLGLHSRVEACGELPIVPRLADQLSGEFGGLAGYREKLKRISQVEVAELGNLYLSRARVFRHTEKPRFTDKLHMNWKHTGLIHLALPNARILDVRRNPLDCCWSNFKIQFAQGHPASTSLGNIGLFYRDYVRFMDHMQAVAPDRILTLRYEEAVGDLEGQTRRILNFLGLEFEPGILDFHQSSDPVATASSEQVRRPLNREGIGAWKPYRQWLGSLIEALGPLAEPELAEADKD